MAGVTQSGLEQRMIPLGCGFEAHHLPQYSPITKDTKMVGAFPPVIKEDIDYEEKYFDLCQKYVELCKINKIFESKVVELQSMLETLSPGVTRG